MSNSKFVTKISFSKEKQTWACKNGLSTQYLLNRNWIENLNRKNHKIKILIFFLLSERNLNQE